MGGKKGDDESTGIGKTRILLDKEWDFIEFADLPRNYIQLYSFIYFMGQEPEYRDKETLSYLFVKFPWMGGYSAVNFYKELYLQIPLAFRPKISSIRYSSPGFIELNEAIWVAAQIHVLVEIVCRSLDKINKVYTSIQKGLSQRELTKINIKEREKFILKAEDKKFIEESFSIFSGLLKIDLRGLKASTSQTNSNGLLDIKILLSLYRRIRNLAKLQIGGRIKFAILKKGKRK